MKPLHHEYIYVCICVHIVFGCAFFMYNASNSYENKYTSPDILSLYLMLAALLFFFFWSSVDGFMYMRYALPCDLADIFVLFFVYFFSLSLSQYQTIQSRFVRHVFKRLCNGILMISWCSVARHANSIDHTQERISLHFQHRWDTQQQKFKCLSSWNNIFNGQMMLGWE